MEEIKSKKDIGEIDVSVIIVNYNTSGLINDAIESIIDKTEGISYEIIVVDNNTENLSVTIKHQNQCRMKLIQLPENVGFGRANNAGLMKADGRNIFFLNPDTVLVNNAICILSDYIDSHLDCGVCGGNLFNEEMKPATSFRRLYPSGRFLLFETLTGGLYEKFLSKGEPRFNSSGNIQEVAYIVGADLMMRKSDLKKFGAFNPEFFMYYEEIELCHRFHQAGMKIISVPQAEIQHLAGKAGMMGERKATLHYQSTQTYFRLTRTPKELHRYRKLLNQMINLRLMIGRLTGRQNMVVFWSVWRRLFDEDKDKFK